VHEPKKDDVSTIHNEGIGIGIVFGVRVLKVGFMTVLCCEIGKEF